MAVNQENSKTIKVALYAGGHLGPDDIGKNSTATKDAGWTTIILSLFHIGRPDIGQQWGDIIFNGTPVVISEGEYKADPSWPVNVAALKQAPTSVTGIYASFGGGGPVYDFTSIQHIYESNGNSFSGTMLEKNFQVLKSKFPAIDGIDMDCEDNYDEPSFVAFCEMVARMGFGLTAAPYSNIDFWTSSLKAVYDGQYSGAWKWWNLQCYDGGAGNQPSNWADGITIKIPGFDTAGFIVVGDSATSSPSAVKKLMTSFAKDASTSGGFIWSMDLILKSGFKMTDYVDAIEQAFSGEVRTGTNTNRLKLFGICCT